MEKSGYNPNYPQMPPQMTSAGAQMQDMPPAPPSYDQATVSGVQPGYPPVQVLGPPLPNAAARTEQQPQYPQQPQFQQPTFTAHRHNPPAGHTTYAAPPQAGMQQPSVVIIQQQAILPLGPDPTFITCPACHAQKMTRVEYDPSSRTHLMAALLCLLGLWCCVCVPYCAGSCMNTNHYCGNCNKFLGTYGNSM